MAYSFTERKRVRKSFGRIENVVELPNLLEIQKESYEHFLKSTPMGKSKKPTGIQDVFSSVFPISDNANTSDMEFVSYELEEPKFDVDECLQRDLTYGAPMKALLRLVVHEVDEATDVRSVKDIKEQEVYLCDVPLMTDNGTFIINGTERVIVSQMHRSPGVFFDHDNGSTHSSGKLLFTSRVIPHRGSWLDFEFDHKDNIHVRIDRRRKLPASVMLRALGLSTQEILDTFYDTLTVKAGKKPGEWNLEFAPSFYEGVKLGADLINAKDGKTIADAGKKISRRKIKELVEKDKLEWILQTNDQMYGRFLGEDLIDNKSGEVLFEAGAEIDNSVLDAINSMKMKEFKVLKIDHLNVGAYIRNTLQIDKTSSPEEALIEIYRVIRPGEPPTAEAAQNLFHSLFFDGDRYDLSAVGRMKMNARLGFEGLDEEDDALRILRNEDILAIVKKLCDIKDGNDETDDIDHLSNRRIRSVGELMENQFRIGLLRMERAIRERMSSAEIATMMPQELVNSRPLSASIREFFSSSQLSQFMDQTNPLSEVTHKRRLSALGPGGLTRERAGFEVRDVHVSHYGRICPIETPEGPNIGLINSLATYARINKYGFIETPYRKVDNAVAKKEVEYMSAIKEGKYTIAQANTQLDEKGKIVEEMVVCRRAGETVIVPREQVDLMDVAPKQIVSVAAALIPFLENDDANRALMGSNMQRQGVPLLQAEAPFVGTGMERTVARDSGVTTVSKRAGVVEYVDAQRVVVKASGKVAAGMSGVDIYRLNKFKRSNQNSCMNQRPLVKKGDKVQPGDILADGPCTDKGELALGRNALVAFMPWNGYNFEDSILISERIVRDDVYTSIHIDEFDVMARDTKLGAEEITRDIPNVSEEALSNLDESGIIRIGAQVSAGDILVGKITPKGETPMTPEEKLLRAIFGEKAADVRDSSLRVPPSLDGTVVGVKIFNRRGGDKDTRTLQIEEQEIAKLKKDVNDERRILEDDIYGRLEKLLVGAKTSAKTANFAKGAEISADKLAEVKKIDWWNIAVADDKVMKDVEKLRDQLDVSVERLKKFTDGKIAKIRSADELSPGVLKMVKVFVAVKRKLQPGDKMAGRHGNKGVISKVLPIEDMPYMEDGRPVDIVLNPLGVPSRMNVGQILETHLGWAAAGIGRKIGGMLEDVSESKDVKGLREYLTKFYGEDHTGDMAELKDEEVLELANNLKNGVTFATPVFDGAREEDINAMLEEAGVSTTGQSTLFDGLTGDKFDRPVTVGYMYMLKLHHLVDEKIHARSIGPYSLVTQQPLGGKAQFGGQRFGEMEVWALQAYGASYTLQEMLTVKSDDVAGRTRTYEAIVRGETNFEAGVPESFNVLVQEIQALGLDVNLINDDATDATSAEAAE
tara:strand:+ start:13833 stop:17975 length:4143 start_codon:yes stop_codon:yes gene_type:complete